MIMALNKKTDDNFASAFLKSAVEIYSPSGQEEELARFLADTMKELGFKVRIDEVGNVHGTIGSGKPTTLLCGHMDTVPGILPIRVEDGLIHGRGAVDAKGPLIAMIVAAARHGLSGESGRILVIGAVEEERKGDGVRALVQQRPKAEYAIFGEPGGSKRITIGYKGSLHLVIDLSAESGHSSAPWKYPNSILKAFDLWSLISNYTSKRVKAKSHYTEVSSCLTGIKGGSDLSVTPERCEMNIDIRIPIGLTVDDILFEMGAEIDRFGARNPETKIEVHVEDRVEPFETSIRSPIVQALSGAIKDVYHQPAEYIRKTGTGDMNILGHELGIPTVTYGPGDSHLDHSPHERIDVEEFLGSIQVYQRALERLSRLPYPEKTRA